MPDGILAMTDGGKWVRIRCFQVGSPGAFQGRPAFLTRWPWRRWSVEGGVQTQSGDEGNGLAEGLAAVEQVQSAGGGSPTRIRGRWGSQRRPP